jgi:Na+/H+ antiporter NhaD/arsenite permease-like protein
VKIEHDQLICYSHH